MLKSIRDFLDSLDKAGIRYCHWKSNEHLDASATGDTDLDMLFSATERTALEAVLAECGLKRFRSVHTAQYNAIEDFIGFDGTEAKIWHLHLHYRLTLGEKHLKGYTLPWTEKILDSRIFNEEFGIYTSSCETELFLLFMRMSLKLRLRDAGKKIGKDDIKELEWLYERADAESTVSLAKSFLNDAVATEYRRLISIRPTKKNQLKKLQKLLRKSMKCFTSYSAAGSFVARSRRELCWLFGGVGRRLGLNSLTPSRRISPSGGALVAVLGCDGAGKSTTLKYVRKEFGKKLDCICVYLGSGDGSSSLLRKPMKLVAKKVGGKGVGAKVAKEQDSGKKLSVKARLYKIAKIIWADTLAAEKKKKLRQITKARNRGMLVLTDRYPQTEAVGYSDGPLLDRYINSKGIAGRAARKERRIYESAYINPPDLTVKLMVPTEVAIARKPEMTAEEIEAKKAAVRSLNISPNSVEINTDCDIKQSLSLVMAEIWKCL